MLMLLVFWCSIALIVFTYAGFPLILKVRATIARFRKTKRTAMDQPVSLHDPAVSILMAVHNEEECILKKLDNICDLLVPGKKPEVIIASDGSTDKTNELISSFSRIKIHLLRLPRQGKNAALNAAASRATGEILVFTDADALMNRESLLHLIEPFRDLQVGAVGGDYRYTKDDSNSNEEKTYWKYDRILKGLQSRSGSMTSATGQIYAIRRSLFLPIPQKVVDDFYVSVQAPLAHKRLVYESRAVAYGPAADAGKPEFDRKVRVITSGLRTVWLVRNLLNPAKYGFYAFQLLTHKVLRRILVIPLILIGISSIALSNRDAIYQTAALGQFLIHGLACVGYLLRNRAAGRLKIFSLPFFFDLVNLACLVAVFNLFTGVGTDIWKPMRNRTPAHTMESRT